MKNVRLGNLLIVGLFAALFFVPAVKALLDGTMPLETLSAVVVICGGGIVGMVVVMTIIVIRSTRATSRDLIRLSVLKFEGVVRSQHASTYPITSYTVHFEKRSFFVRNREQLHAFEVGLGYRVYFVHYMNREFVLSVEAIS